MRLRLFALEQSNTKNCRECTWWYSHARVDRENGKQIYVTTPIHRAARWGESCLRYHPHHSVSASQLRLQFHSCTRKWTAIACDQVSLWRTPAPAVTTEPEVAKKSQCGQKTVEEQKTAWYPDVWFKKKKYPKSIFVVNLQEWCHYTTEVAAQNRLYHMKSLLLPKFDPRLIF